MKMTSHFGRMMSEYEVTMKDEDDLTDFFVKFHGPKEYVSKVSNPFFQSSQANVFPSSVFFFLEEVPWVFGLFVETTTLFFL